MKHLFFWFVSFLSVWLMGHNAGTHGSWWAFFCLLAIWIFSDKYATELYRKQISSEIIAKLLKATDDMERANNKSPIIDI